MYLHLIFCIIRPIMKIILIGAGRLATNLAKALLKTGHDILQVYSRTEKSATELADIAGAAPVTELSRVRDDADLYILSVKDSALAELIPSLCHGKETKVFVHTAGSIPMDIFEGMALHYGVLYPMQTFSKEKEVDFSVIPCFIEGNDEFSEGVIAALAHDLSQSVFKLSSEDRKYLHLAAVFACNFANHCFAISHDLLAKHGIPFDVMLPLIDETAGKVHTLTPAGAQTGPAVRYDENVIRTQMELLRDNPLFRDIYERMSMSIHLMAQNNQENK